MPDIDQTLTDGWKLHQAGKVHQAEQIYQQALAADASYAPTWYHLGIAYHDEGRFEDAISAYQTAIKLAPGHVFALNNLGNLYGKLHQLDKAIECFDRALSIDPGFALARNNKGLTLVWEGHVESAIRTLEEALHHAPDDAEVHFNLGVLRLLLGDFAGGWPEYEWRYRAGHVTLPRLDPSRLWNGSALYGKTILLSVEQGLGDIVQFVRYAAWLKQRYKCRVLFYCPTALRALLARCEGIDEWVEDRAPEDLPSFDVFAPLTRVPAVLAHTTKDFPDSTPYLFADAQLTKQWSQRLAAYPGPKLGICWRGSDKHSAGSKRHIPLSEFSRLTTIAGTHVFSLQKGPGSEEIRAVPEIVDLGPQLDETGGAFADTAAIMQNLDLVITCDTSVAHVAGALGVPVWVALSNVPDWRWGLTGETTVWYPTMRLFRQTSPGNWAGVMDRIISALAKL